MSTALAQVWEGGANFRLAEVDLPELADGETLVQLSAATICGSDRHTVAGRRPGACPSILGHEGVGVIVATRRGDLAVGQRVVFSVTVTCGRCPNCRRGLSAKCDGVLKTGHESFDGAWSLSGTYATHIHLPAGTTVVPVPDSVPDAAAATAGCAVATVMAVMEQSGNVAGRRVLVNGIGMLGLVAVAAARAGGAEQIIACDPLPDNLRLVDHLVDLTVTPGKLPTVDVALELSGAVAGVQACLDSLDVGGVAVLAGSVTPGPEVTVNPEWVVRGWRTITGVHNFEPRHLVQAVDFLAAEGDTLPFGQILGGPVRLDQLPEQFANPDGSLRTVLTFR